MPTIRVYATDSTQGKIVFQEKANGSYSYRIDKSTEKRYEYITITTQIDNRPYNSKQYDKFVYLPDLAYGSALTFDFEKIPELRGNRVTAISGPWIYLEDEASSSDILNYPYTRDHSVITSPVIRFFYRDEIVDVIFNGEWTRNNIWSYFNTRPGNTNANLVNGRFEHLVSAGLFAGSPYADGTEQSTNVRFSAFVSLVFESHLGAARPYVDVTYEPADIFVIPMSPIESPIDQDWYFYNEKEDIYISWAANWSDENAVGTFPELQSAKIEWRDITTLTTRTIHVSDPLSLAREQVIVPAGTFPNDLISWRMQATTTRGVTSPFCDWQMFTTIDRTPLAPERLAPDYLTIDSSIPNTFTWNHTIDTGTDQYRFELQYKGSESDWVAYANEVTSRESVVIPAKVLPTGQVLWRVRTYNTDDVPGPWSQAQIISRRAPDAPVVKITPWPTSPRPSLIWQAEGQTGFQVQAPGYDSGERYGTQKQFQIPIFLPDGETEIRVRVVNRFEMWSAWGTVTTYIKGTAGDIMGNLKLHAREVDCGVRLWWRNEKQNDGAIGYHVLRDGETIAQLGGDTYAMTDWMASAGEKHSYQVRRIEHNSFYWMSNVVQAHTRVEEAAICIDGKWDWIPLQYRIGSEPEFSAEQAQEITYHYFSGRKLPVADVFDRQARTVTTAFSASTSMLKQLLDMCGNTVILRYGDKMAHGVLDSVNVESGRVGEDSDVTLSITETGGAG